MKSDEIHEDRSDHYRMGLSRILRLVSWAKPKVDAAIARQHKTTECNARLALTCATSVRDRKATSLFSRLTGRPLRIYGSDRLAMALILHSAKLKLSPVKSSAPALEGLTHRHSAAIPEPSTFPHQRNPHPRIHEIRSFASKKLRFLRTERTNESSRRISNQVFSIPLFTFSSIECRPRLRFVFP